MMLSVGSRWTSLNLKTILPRFGYAPIRIGTNRSDDLQDLLEMCGIIYSLIVADKSRYHIRIVCHSHHRSMVVMLRDEVQNLSHFDLCRSFAKQCLDYFFHYCCLATLRVIDLLDCPKELVLKMVVHFDSCQLFDLGEDVFETSTTRS